MELLEINCRAKVLLKGEQISVHELESLTISIDWLRSEGVSTV